MKEINFLRLRLGILVLFFFISSSQFGLRAQQIVSISTSLYSLSANASFFTNLNNKHLVFVYIIDKGNLSMEGYIYSGLKRRKPKKSEPDIIMSILISEPVKVKLVDGNQLSSMTLPKRAVKNIQKAINDNGYSTIYFEPQADAEPDNIDGYRWLVKGSKVSLDKVNAELITGVQFNPSPPREFN